MREETRETGDHRTRLTKIMIREALMKKMEEKPVGAITVAELSRSAGISRTTFYAHYATPEEVLEDIQEQLIEEMRPYNVSSGLTAYEAMLGVLEANKRNERFWLLTVKDQLAWTMFAEKMVEILTEFGKPGGFPNQPTREQSLERFREQAVIRGAAGIALDWMRRGMAEPPELVAQAVSDFVNRLAG